MKAKLFLFMTACALTFSAAAQSETINETPLNNEEDDNVASSVVEDYTRWDFTLFDTFHSGRKKPKRNFPIGFEGFGFGFVTSPNAPSGMKVDMGESYEFNWIITDITSVRMAPRWKAAICFGLNWRNYRMTGHTQFLKDNDNILLSDYPAGSNPKFSRIKVFSLQVPFTVAYSFSRGCNLQLSAIANFNTHASLKTRYRDADGRKKKITSSDIHQQKVTLDLQARLNYRSLGCYVKYSPCDVLKKDYGPSFNGLSAGVIVSY